MTLRRPAALALAAGALLVACEPGPRRTEPAAPGADAGHELVVDGNVFRFDGHELRMLDRMESWTGVLGPPSRTRKEWWALAHVWDELGIAVFAKPTPDDRAYVNAVTVELLPANDPSLAEFSPRTRSQEMPAGAFRGRFSVEHAVLSPGWNEIAPFMANARGVVLDGVKADALMTGFEATAPDLPAMRATMELEARAGAGARSRRFCEIEFDVTDEWTFGTAH